jgi:hypothetical protein
MSMFVCALNLLVLCDFYEHLKISGVHLSSQICALHLEYVFELSIRVECVELLVYQG